MCNDVKAIIERHEKLKAENAMMRQMLIDLTFENGSYTLDRWDFMKVTDWLMKTGYKP